MFLGGKIGGDYIYHELNKDWDGESCCSGLGEALHSGLHSARNLIYYCVIIFFKPLFHEDDLFKIMQQKGYREQPNQGTYT